MLKIAVLISGRGSNLQALVAAAQQAGYPAQIACVIADQNTSGLAYALAANIPAYALLRKNYPDRQSFENDLSAHLESHGVQLVCLAGFMRILSPSFVEHWLDRLVSIHPSLLPAFQGLDAYSRALEAGVKITGCTVHFVRAAMDDGPIIIQAAVPVLPDDSEVTLGTRVLEMEHKIYPYAIRLIAEGRVNVHGERTFIAGAVAPDVVSNPVFE